MKYLVVGDLHCKPDNLDKVQELFTLVEGFGLPVIWLGDQLDTKEVIRGRCLNTLYNYLKTSKLNHTLLIGNHCYFNLDCEDHSQQVLKDLPNVTIVDELMEIAPRIYALPYIHDQDILKKTLKSIPKDTTIFGHFEVTGFDFGNGYICDTGTSPKEFKKFKRVISGHFHKYASSGNFTYLGTPFSHSFGEANQEKYLGVFDSETDSMDLQETPFPKHISEELHSYAPLTLEKMQNSSNHCRVVLTGDNKEFAQLDKSLYPKIKFIEKFTSKNPIKKSIKLEAMDNEAKFKTWSKSVAQLPEEVLAMGLEILKLNEK